MQIIEQTSTVLKLQDEQGTGCGCVCVVLFCMGMPFVLTGLTATLTFHSVGELKCNRLEPTQVACELTSSSLLEKHITPIPTLQGAEVEVSKDSDGNITYQLVLLTKNGKIPANGVYISGVEGEINAFVSDPQQRSLSIQKDHRWFLYLFGAFCTLIGGVPIFLSLKGEWLTSCTFDKDSGRMYLKQQSLFKSDVREQMLDEIKEVKIIEGSDDGFPGATLLVLRSGETIRLQIDGSLAEEHKVAQSINQFLGVKS